MRRTRTRSWAGWVRLNCATWRSTSTSWPRRFGRSTRWASSRRSSCSFCRRTSRPTRQRQSRDGPCRRRTWRPRQPTHQPAGRSTTSAWLPSGLSRRWLAMTSTARMCRNARLANDDKWTCSLRRKRRLTLRANADLDTKVSRSRLRSLNTASKKRRHDEQRSTNSRRAHVRWPLALSQKLRQRPT